MKPRPKYKSLQALFEYTQRPSSETVCHSCQRMLQRRQYASAAVAAAPSNEPLLSIDSKSPTPPSSTSKYKPTYALRAGVVLSRPPVITRDLHPFEKAFFVYQKRLNERLVLPFTRYFYINKGTPEDLEWKRKIKERLTPARDIGVYNAYGKEAWNDEILVGSKISEPDWQMEQLLQDAEEPSQTVKAIAQGEAEDGTDQAGLLGEAEKASGSDTQMTKGEAERAAASAKVVAETEMNDQQQKTKKNVVERPQNRVTEADKTNDTKSLNRVLQRTLYLLVKNSNDSWVFPSARMEGGEGLHQAAERVLVQAGGQNMNTWIVGNAPVGHQACEYDAPLIKTESQVVELGDKTFFMKGRIMAGQANMKVNNLGLKDYQWLTKDEIKSVVSPDYWDVVENMLSSR